VAGGLVALLDDVAVLARAAAASVDDIGVAAARASAKAAGVVVDDAAVTPQYVRQLAADRELPIIRRIAVGSLRNKLLILLPAVLVLSQFAPRLLTPILMLGAVYLCYEGAEKVWASSEVTTTTTPTAMRAWTRTPSCPAPCAPTSSCPRRSWSSP
jgi:predicted DNA repair protein MutK